MEERVDNQCITAALVYTYRRSTIFSVYGAATIVHKDTVTDGQLGQFDLLRAGDHLFTRIERYIHIGGKHTSIVVVVPLEAVIDSRTAILGQFGSHVLAVHKVLYGVRVDKGYTVKGNGYSRRVATEVGCTERTLHELTRHIVDHE